MLWMGLLSLFVPVKPLADIVANYTCRDGHKKCKNNVQVNTPPSVASMGWGSTSSIAKAGPVRKTAVSRTVLEKIFPRGEPFSRKSVYMEKINPGARVKEILNKTVTVL